MITPEESRCKTCGRSMSRERMWRKLRSVSKTGHRNFDYYCPNGQCYEDGKPGIKLDNPFDHTYRVAGWA